MVSPNQRTLLEAIRALLVAPRPANDRISAKGPLPARLEPVALRLADLTEHAARTVVPRVPELVEDAAVAETWLATSRVLARSYVRLSDLAVRKGLLGPDAEIATFSESQLVALAAAIVERYAGTHSEVGFTKSRIESTPTKQQSGADIRALRRANSKVEEWLIRRVVCSSAGDPAGTLAAIQQAVARFTPDFPSIPSSDLTNIIATNRKNPRGALTRAVRLQQALTLEFPEFPAWAITRVAVQSPQNARARLTAAQDAVAMLTEQFPGEDPSTILYVSVMSGDPAARIETYIQDRTELAEKFPGIPRHVREVVALHSPRMPVAAMRAVAADAARLAADYPELPAATVLTIAARHRKNPEAALNTIRQQVDEIATAFPTLPRWVAAKVAALQSERPREVAAALVETHDRLVREHPDISPSRLLHIASINPLQPGEHIPGFLERRAALRHTYPKCSVGLIDEIAGRFIQDPLAGMRAALEARRLLQETRPDLPDWVVNRLARSAPRNVESKLADFDLGCSVLRQLNPDATATAIFREALNRPVGTTAAVEAFLNGDALDDHASMEAERLMGLMERAQTAAPTTTAGRAAGES